MASSSAIGRPSRIDGRTYRSTARKYFCKVSVDSFDNDELLRGGKAGADYLLSLNEDNLHIADQVKSIGRVVIAHEDQITCGFGAEIAARVAGELFEHLDAPVRRVGALDAPVAYCPALEEAILPQTADIVNAIRATATY